MEPETLWERIKQGLLERATLAAQKAEHLGRVGRARLDIAETRHAIRDALSELGGAVYAYLQHNPDAAIGKEEDVQALIARIRELEGVLQEREARLQAVKATVGGGAADGDGDEEKAEDSKD